MTFHKKGQVDLMTLIGFVIALIIYIVALYPLMNSYIQPILTNSTYGAPTRFLLQISPFLFLVFMFVGIYYYATGRTRQARPY